MPQFTFRFPSGTSSSNVIAKRSKTFGSAGDGSSATMSYGESPKVDSVPPGDSCRSWRSKSNRLCGEFYPRHGYLAMKTPQNDADRQAREVVGLDVPGARLTDDDRGRLSRLEVRVARLEGRRGWIGRLIDWALGREEGP
jgi:hypothetical protein